MKTRTIALICIVVLLPVACTAAEDGEGFVSLFDGQTLSGWDGDRTIWLDPPEPDFSVRGRSLAVVITTCPAGRCSTSAVARWSSSSDASS